ncbi:MAG: LamG domain-containing protein [Dehalococcoidia bacterium]
MSTLKKQPQDLRKPRNSRQTPTSHLPSSRSRTTRRTFLLRTSGVLAGAALGGEYLAPNITSLSVPPAFASTSPFPQFGYVGALLNLAGYWKLNDGFGFTAKDSSGNDNHGILLGNPTWSADGLDFNSPGSAVRIPLASDLNNLDTLSVAMWFYADSTGQAGKGRFISKYNSFGLRFSNRRSMIYFVANRWSDIGGKWRVRSLDGASLLGVWHHLVVTYKYSSPGRQPKMYLDGQRLPEVQTIRRPVGMLEDDPTPIYIGNRDSLNRTFFDGRISDVRVYPHILRDHEIAHLFAGS